MARRAGLGGEEGLHPIDFAEKHGVRLLTTSFEPGDVVLLSMLILHGACDHTDAAGRLRLSCDIRYQPAAHPTDDSRFFVSCLLLPIRSASVFSHPPATTFSLCLSSL